MSAAADPASVRAGRPRATRATARRRTAAFTAAALASGACPAHPVDELVRNAYLDLVPGEVRLLIELVPGAEVTGALLGPFDANGDGELGPAEARAFAASALERSVLRLDGRPVDWSLDGVEAPSPEALALGHAVLRVRATAARSDRPGARALDYRSEPFPVASRATANAFVPPEHARRYRIDRQRREGGRLIVDYAVLEPGAAAPSGSVSAGEDP